MKKKSRKRNFQAANKKPPKKKELQFDIKTKLATAISKHPNLFDVNNPKYSDSRAENASWNDVSKSIDLSIADCMKHWASLKRSASYFARPARIPFKSGAAANELDDDDGKKYKDEWEFAEVMNFYTPPALKKHEKLISGGIPSTSKENDGESEAVLQGETSTMGSFETEDDNVYVSQINTKIFLNSNKRYHFNPFFSKFPGQCCSKAEVKAKGHRSGKFCSHGQQLLKLFEFEDSHSARTEATAQTFHHVGSFRQHDYQVGRRFN